MEMQELIEKLEKMKKPSDEDTDDDIYSSSGGNIDDAYQIGIDLGQIWGFNEAIDEVLKLIGAK